MAKTVGLFQRGGVWTLRVVIPLDLRDAYGGRTKIVESLGTTNHTTAKEAAEIRRGELRAEFAARRVARDATRVDRITPDLVQNLARHLEARLLGNDDKLRDQPEAARQLLQALRPARASKLRIGAAEPPPAANDIEPARGPLDGLPEALAEELAAVNQDMDKYAGQVMARRHLAAVLPLAQAEAQKLGWTFDAATPGAREALLEALKAYRKALQAIGQRDQGEVIETPATPTSAPAASPARPVKLRDVFPQWQASKARKPATVKAAEKALSLYEEATGDPPIATLTRAQGVDMRAFLLDGGVTAKTARDRFDYIKGFLNFAHRELELLPRNPWSGLAIEYSTTTPRRPWSGEQ
ncbi:MAG: hypothetical protein JNM26_15330, partial [Ideonella sp.]|nr:hypothetical protein [Ideonella sp.]